MLILDIDYLESVTEDIAMDLIGSGKAVSISNFFVGAFGTSTYTSVVATNRTATSSHISSASSSIQANAASSNGNAIATASSYSSSSS